jgi:hypothetical protein
VIAVYLIFGILAVFTLSVLVLRFLLRGGSPTHNGISRSDLCRYLAYLLQRALANGGTVHVEPEGFKAAVNITKHEHLRKPTTISVKLSSGYVPRDALTDVADVMSRFGFECKLKYTKSRRLLHSLTISLTDDHSGTPDAVVDIISKIFNALGAGDGRTFSVSIYGPMKFGMSTDDGDVVKHTSNYLTGWAVGFVVGKIWRWMRGA